MVIATHGLGAEVDALAIVGFTALAFIYDLASLFAR